MCDERKDFRVSTLRQIIEAVKRLEGYGRGNVIGIIMTGVLWIRKAEALRMEERELR